MQVAVNTKEASRFSQPSLNIKESHHQEETIHLESSSITRWAGFFFHKKDIPPSTTQKFVLIQINPDSVGLNDF
jgi:hypothetical protein